MFILAPPSYEPSFDVPDETPPHLLIFSLLFRGGGVFISGRVPRATRSRRIKMRASLLFSVHCLFLSLSPPFVHPFFASPHPPLMCARPPLIASVAPPPSLLAGAAARHKERRARDARPPPSSLCCTLPVISALASTRPPTFLTPAHSQHPGTRQSSLNQYIYAVRKRVSRARAPRPSTSLFLPHTPLVALEITGGPLVCLAPPFFPA